MHKIVIGMTGNLNLLPSSAKDTVLAITWVDLYQTSKYRKSKRLRLSSIIQLLFSWSLKKEL